MLLAIFPGAGRKEADSRKPNTDSLQVYRMLLKEKLWSGAIEPTIQTRIIRARALHIAVCVYIYIGNLLWAMYRKCHCNIPKGSQPCRFFFNYCYFYYYFFLLLKALQSLKREREECVCTCPVWVRA
ncbi:hypothetical protein KIL84_015380 [Mauremys mutica]|uniref:Uncharacterized protein n=1 Tax=Mauremys mutica TaxID=74926 RepID=A0A9D3WRV1_9SAUR|nr:hypothetical protein KIL84_015380 [Mauremys mutica]